MWDGGFTTTLIDDGLIPVINDRGDVAFIRGNNPRQVWDLWYYFDGQFYQVTQDPLDNIVPDINNAGEIAWSWGSYPARNVRYLRRFQRGDLNCDGAFNGADIDVFFRALGDPIAYAIAFPECDWMLADLNSDGLVNGADIDPFFEALVP